jgi:hypothetical protein
MKISQLAIAAFLAGGFWVVGVEEGLGGGPATEAPLPTSDEPSAATTCRDPSPCAESCCGCGRWCCDGKLADPWKLPQPCLFQEAGINLSGWVQSGLYTNAHGAASNGPLGLNNLTDFNLHQFWVSAERKTDTQKNAWDLGGRIDYVFGVDAPDTQAFGDQSWDFGWNSSSRYGSAIPQSYLELAFGDWSIKGGRFYTPHGYEVVPATGNFFYSHSYTFYFGEPFTHTGFTVTRKLGEKLSVFGGWVDGWDSGWANRNAADNFLGGINLTLSERATFAWSVLAGNWGSGQFGNAGDIYMNSFLLNYKLSDNWTYVFQHDLGNNTNIAPGSTQWYGIDQYLLYKINDCWSAGGRLEWFRDNNGARVVTGNAGNYYEATLGVNYKPHANVLLRPEIRYDWFDGAVAGPNRPFNNGASLSQFSGGFDFIVTF